MFHNFALLVRLPSLRLFTSQSIRVSAVTSAFAFFVCLFAVQNASAATYTVTTIADSGAGSLRQAVVDANGTAANDTIIFNIPAASCPAVVCTITLTSGALGTISTATAGTLTITNSTGASNLRISGNNASRVFTVGMDGNLTLNGLTVTNGFGDGSNTDGSGIYNFRGTLSLTNSIVSGNGNATRNHGGGIYNNGGTLSLTNSTLSGNIIGNNGGSIYNEGGTTTLTNSTVSGNSGNYGGGIINSGGTLSLTNSTVSGNTALNGGGGISSGGTLNLTSVTVAFNTATNSISAGGVGHGGTANLLNTIVAKNTANQPDYSGAIAAGNSFNLIGNGTGMSGITNGTNGNQVGVDPPLAPLAFNGGTVRTHALCTASGVPDASCTAASPAIDTGTA